jgi:hypothetical protein
MGFLEGIKKGLQATGNFIADTADEIALNNKEKRMLEERIKNKTKKYTFIRHLKDLGVPDMQFNYTYSQIFSNIHKISTLKNFLDKQRVRYDDIGIEIEKLREELKLKKKQRGVDAGLIKKEILTAELNAKEELFYKIIKSIKDFKTFKEYNNEESYHAGLYGWLKNQFPNAKAEFQVGASRPDIVIDDIAIEVKGPTDNQALDSLTTKCLKYEQYFKHLIIVLFNPVFSELNYREIASGIKKHFPHVEIIRKD